MEEREENISQKFLKMVLIWKRLLKIIAVFTAHKEISNVVN